MDSNVTKYIRPSFLKNQGIDLVYPIIFDNIYNHFIYSIFTEPNRRKMIMKSDKLYRIGFLIAAIYDFILGIGFFLFYSTIYSMFDITLPENPGYIHLSSAFVFCQGAMYYFVYLNLERNIDIAKIGVVYKIAYTGVCFYYWIIGGLPHPMFAVFGICDIGFIVFFLFYLKNYDGWKTEDI